MWNEDAKWKTMKWHISQRAVSGVPSGDSGNSQGYPKQALAIWVAIELTQVMNKFAPGSQIMQK